MGSQPEAADLVPASPVDRSGLAARTRPGDGTFLRAYGRHQRQVRGTILGYLELGDTRWSELLLGQLALVIGLVSSWLVFLWVFARLPREPVTWRSAIKAAIAAAVGLEIIKRTTVFYLATVTKTPAGAAVGPILGLLIFIFTVSQFVIFRTAWAATARENRVEQPPPVPPPAVICPEVTVRSGLGPGAVASLLSIGAVAGVLGDRLLGHRK